MYSIFIKNKSLKTPNYKKYSEYSAYRYTFYDE